MKFQICLIFSESEIGTSFKDQPATTKDRTSSSHTKSAILHALGEELCRINETPNGHQDSFASLNSSTASDWFENTHDEMLLYEK